LFCVVVFAISWVFGVGGWLWENGWIGFGIGSPVALASVTCAASWTGDVLAWVIDTFAICWVAELVGFAPGVCAGVGVGVGAFAVEANLVFSALDGGAWVCVFDAFSVLAVGAGIAFDIGTGADALSIAAELSTLAGDTRTGIFDALFVEAVLAVGATECGAIFALFFDARAIDASFACCAFDVLAYVNAFAIPASFVATTTNATTGEFDACAFFANKAFGALLCTTAQTNAIDTAWTFGIVARDIVIFAVAVVVESVADFGFGLGCVTGCPGTVLADLFA
jgi:hypothetical protein